MSMQSSSPCAPVLSREQIAQAVKKIAAEFSTLPAEEIEEHHNVVNDLGFDSLDVVECTMEIEEQFGISVPDELGERARTVGEIVDGVAALLAHPPLDG